MTGSDVAIPRGAALTDIAVVLGCSLAYVGASLAGVRIGWIIPVVVLVLGGYGWFVLRRRGETWRDYGVRTDNLPAAGRLAGLWTLLAALAIAGWAAYHDAMLWRPEMALLLPLYPAWGLIQQFIFQGLLHRRLMQVLNSRPLALATTAGAFGLVHVDDWRVAALTVVGGAGWSYCYQRAPNIPVLGVSHGVLAALAYPLVLSDNPLQRIF
jgi:hypothetical protein